MSSAEKPKSVKQQYRERENKQPKHQADLFESRILSICKWLREGTPYLQLRSGGAKTFGISTRQFDTYLALARQRLAEEYRKAIPTLAEELDDALVLGQSEALKKGDIASFNAAVMHRAKMAGLLRDKVEINDLKAPDLSTIDASKIRAKLRQ